MRFLFVTQYYAPELGPPQTRLAAVTRELRRAGHDVEVLTALPNYPTGKIFAGYRRRLYRREVIDGTVVHRVWMHASLGRGFSRALGYLSFTGAAGLRMLGLRRPDWVFVESPPPTLAVPAIALAKLWRARVILNIADLWPDVARETGALTNPGLIAAAERLERWSYRHADLVCAVTEGIRSQLINKKNVPPEKILFLPNGVDPTLFHPEADDGRLAIELGLDGKKLVVYAGTFGYIHGLEKILDAAALLATQSPELHFVFVGGGSEREKLLAQAKGMRNVTFLPPAPPEYLARLYANATVGLSSLRAGPQVAIIRPSKMWQIFASGKPILYVGEGEGAGLVAEADAGTVVSSDAPADIAHALLDLAGDPEKACRFGANGRRFAESQYSWPMLIRRWLADLEGRHA